VRLFKALREQVNDAATDLSRLAHQFQESAMRVRMIPISQVVNRFPRMVRDLSRQSGKQVALEIRGADTELDKSVMDIIADPLIHLLRNAVDHGIEAPAEREAQGKDPRGRLLLSAAHQGNQVVITLQDDGRGVNVDAVRRKALQCHLATADEAAAMTDDEVVALIFRTGFSTLDRASQISGRGVGLHLVTRYLERVHGTLNVHTTPGAGATFVLTFPLTLAIIPALLVDIQSDLYALALTAVEEAVSIPEHELTLVAAQRTIPWRGERLPFVRLSDVLGQPSTPTMTPSRWPLLAELDVPLPAVEEIFPDPFFEHETRARLGVIISAGQRALGLEIDHFLGECDIVVTAIKHDLLAIDGIAGASIQPDGRIAFVLDAAALIRLADNLMDHQILRQEGGV
jgi:two-component system, chemotaxis family, sensor kinase CheA